MKRLIPFLLLFHAFHWVGAQCACAKTSVTAGNPLCDTTKFNWAKWTLVNNTTATGVISSSVNVTVTKSVNDLSTTGGMFNGGAFPPQYQVPINSTSLLNNLAGTMTFCFSQPVVNPQVAIASMGQGGLPVPVVTSTCYKPIWNGLNMTYTNDTSMTGFEGFTIVKFPGVHSCISLKFLQSEYYTNVTIGVSDTNCQKTTPQPFCNGNSATLYAEGASSYQWLPATGLSIDTGNRVTAAPAATTTYYVTGTGANNCQSTDSIVVTVNSSPVLEITGDTLVCGINQTVLQSTTGFISYQWNTNATSDSIHVGQSGSYSVTVANAQGCSASSEVNVSFTSPPVLASLPDTTLCKGQTLELYTDGAGVRSYSWTPQPGLSCTDCRNPSVSPDSSTKYIVEVNAGTTCNSFDTIEVQVGSLASPTIVADKNIFCSRDSAQICAPAGYAQYQWNTNESNQCIYAKYAGNYYATVYDGNGCTGESNRLTVSVYPLPSVSIIVNGDTLSSFGASSYQWYRNGAPINGATSPIYLATEGGNYSLEIIDANGCSAQSTPVVISGINDLQQSAINIYPNPSSDSRLEFRVTGDWIGSDLEIYDVNGRLVLQSELLAANTQLDLNVQRGVYFIRLRSGERSFVTRWTRM